MGMKGRATKEEENKRKLPKIWAGHLKKGEKGTGRKEENTGNTTILTSWVKATVNSTSPVSLSPIGRVRVMGVTASELYAKKEGFFGGSILLTRFLQYTSAGGCWERRVVRETKGYKSSV